MLAVGKVLKSVAIAAVLVGISFIPGVGPALATALRVAAFTTVLSGATAELFGPKIPRTQTSRLNVSLDPSTPRKAVFGTTAMPLDLRYHESSGTDQEYVDYIIAVAAHKVTSITEIWFEEKQAWTLAGGVTGTYSGYLTVDVRTEGTAGNYISINGGGKWGSTRRLTGCAYLHLRIKRTGVDKKAESPLVSGLPSRVTVIGDGALLYDPRKDSTVPGGSGSHRATDQSTWGAYTNADDTDNPALQLLWWLLGWEIDDKLSIGCGVPYNRIDMESFITAANVCDENVTLAIGGTQKRYRTSGTASDADDRMEIINNFLASMNGTLRDNGGKLTVTALKNDLADYVLTFNEGDMIGGFDWQQTRGLTENYNIARGRYVDPSANSLYQMVDYPEVGFASPDGIERVMSLDLPYVEDGRRAQRIAKQVLQRNQYRGMFSATFNAKALGCQVGDVVRVSLEALGWSNKLFRVFSQEIRFDGQVPMALVEENAAIYAWDADDSAPITPTAPTIYNPLNSPFILGIDDAQTTADDAAAAVLITSAALTVEQTTRADADTALAARATTLEATVNNSTTGVSATAARLTTEETTRATADTALASRSTALEATVNNPTTGVSATAARLTTEETARATADTALASRATALEATVNNATTGVAATSARLTTEESARATADTALASRATTLEATVNNATTGVAATAARLTTEESARATADSALASRATALEATVNSSTDGNIALKARISTEESARASGDSANATSISNLSTTVGANTASISTIQTSVNGLSVRYGVSLDVNGFVTGFVQNNNGTSGTFDILATAFRVTIPGSTPKTVFSVSGSNIEINNNVSINGSLVVSGTVNTTQLTANAATSGNFAYNAASVNMTTSYQDAVEATVTMVGGAAKIDFACYVAGRGQSGGTNILYRLLRNGTQIREGTLCLLPGEQTVYGGTIGDNPQPVYTPIAGMFPFFVLDTSGQTGSVTYKVQLKAAMADYTYCSFAERQLSVTEFRR